MTALDFDALERAAQAATPGPWIARWDQSANAVMISAETNEMVACTVALTYVPDAKQAEEDSDFIAAANPAAALALVAQVRALTEERDRLRAALEKAQAETARMRARWHAAVEMGAESDARAALGAP